MVYMYKLIEPLWKPEKKNVFLILVSYDVSDLFTNVPAHETIEKAFSGNWFNETYLFI